MVWSITFFHFLADFFGAFFKPLGPILAQQLNISTVISQHYSVLPVVLLH